MSEYVALRDEAGEGGGAGEGGSPSAPSAQARARLQGFSTADDCAEDGEAHADPMAALGPAYGLQRVFWAHMLHNLIVGVLMGVLCWLYLESVDRVQKLWWGEPYEQEPERYAEQGSGEVRWLAVMSLGGLGVGVLKLTLGVPGELHGFAQEVRGQYVDWRAAPKVVAASAASLMMGASLGPEAAMGTLGGGIGQWWSERRGLSKELTEQNVIGGMAAALGPLFPSPAVGVMVLAEVGRMETMHGNYMRSTVLLAVAAAAAFGVHFAIAGDKSVPFNTSKIGYKLELWDQWVALAIGLVGGLVGFVHAILIGACKAAFVALQRRLPPRLATVLLPWLGGTLLGLIALWCPFTMGSGSVQSPWLLTLVAKGKLRPPPVLSAGTMFAHCFAKSLAFGISKGSGLVGGAIFPMVFMGTTFGLGAFLVIDELWPNSLNLMLVLTCFTVAVPASILPAPMTLLMFTSFTFQLGAGQASPIFVACCAGHVVTCGAGLLLKVMSVGNRHREGH
jgi:H+/Cl- antiporter ClcA